MKVFVLEDFDERAAVFVRHFVKHELVFCNNAKMAARILDSIKFDLIFLDHDLEDEAFVDSNHPNTGHAVAKAIIGTRNRSTPVIVHSLNSSGAARMLEVLGRSAQRIPFHELDLDQIIERMAEARKTRG